MPTAQIVTPYTGTGIDPDYRRPLLRTHYPPAVGEITIDVSNAPGENMPPSPAALTVERTFLSQATIDTIAADVRYLVLWDTGNSRRQDALPDAAERGIMTTRLITMGYLGPDLANIIKTGRTRKQMADDLIAFQKTRPKG